MVSGQIRDTDFPDFLVTNQNSDGGWGFHPGSTSAVEATAWALPALASSRKAPEQVCTRARDWLLATQLADGSWPAFPGQPRGCWVTSIAARALLRQGGSHDAVGQALYWLVKAWPAEGALWWRLRQALFPARLARQDNSLRGWSWTPGTASWVEPTAHALMFLYAVPAKTLPPSASKRRQLAERMLFDRMCPGGGWNSGNPQVYGVAGIPRVGPTAWALLALQDHADRAEVQSSLRWLEGAYNRIQGGASLALAHLCLRAHGRSLPSLSPALGELYSRNRFFENILTVAWVTLALSEEKSGAVLTASAVVNP